MSLPGEDVPAERITYLPASRVFIVFCTCAHYTVFAPSDAIKAMKASRAGGQ